ncbi:hypothetical protein ANCCAN_03216 [Ancylostoma caninum]|uniref:Uncharacterized protein n=1 Tax=Ancylostoma caninum TaxID=29170 RepID=A0A368H1W0_ANCCA|nr:hypothetical protein ANCCAN_03216 [Ancylostoma caninum]
MQFSMNNSPRVLLNYYFSGIMLPLFFLVVFASVVHTYPTDEQQKANGISVDPLPGVSEENMARLRQMLTQLPPSLEELGKIAEQWTADLPDREEEALKQRMDEMRQKLN